MDVTPKREFWLISTMAASGTDENAAAGGKGQLAYNLAGIALIVLLVAVGVAYLIDQTARNAQRPLPSLLDADPVTQTVAGRELHIPTAWFRFGESITPGFVSQVDLAFALSLTADQPPTMVEATLLSFRVDGVQAALFEHLRCHRQALLSSAAQWPCHLPAIT